LERFLCDLFCGTALLLFVRATKDRMLVNAQKKVFFSPKNILRSLVL
jgi:hypothetical protein